MDLCQAIGLLGLEPFVGADYTDYKTKDVEKCFRQQALRHHPDKGGDASHFQLLQRAKDMLLKRNAGVTMIGSASCGVHETNTTAVSTSLYEHRTCVRQVMVIHGTREAVIAATDDGLIVVELKKDANCYLSGDLERVISFTTHRDDCSFLCCTTAALQGNEDDSFTDVLYTGSKNGFLHKIELSKCRLTPWQLPSRERIVAISAVREWVAIATADGGIYVLEYENGTPAPTTVWKGPPGVGKGASRNHGSAVRVSPETILLEEGSSPCFLNLWVGGSSSSDAVTGRLLMWELNTEDDFFERYDNDEMEDLFGGYGCYDSDTDSVSSNEEKGDFGEGKRNTPAIDVTVQEGPIFSLSKHKQTIAVASGQCIIVWDCYHSTKNLQHPGNAKLVKTKTIKTNDKTLYTLCLNERFLAAAGSGESIMVWDRVLWKMLHSLPLQMSPSGCCLATNCIMTLDWFHENSGILVSGGYDGVVTMWTLANRLER